MSTVAGQPASASSPESEAAESTSLFRSQVSRAAARYRLERLARASRPLAWAVVGCLMVLSVLALTTAVAAWGPLVGVALLAAGALAGWVIYRQAPDRQALFVRIDARLQLPDAVVSTGDWEGSADDEWRSRQRRQTLGLLAQVRWPEAWPVRTPDRLWLPIVSAFALIGGLCFVQHDWNAEQRQMALARLKANPLVTPNQTKPLEEVFKDWDKAQEIAPSPELKELLKELQPLREDLAAGKMTEKDLLLKVSEVNARLQAEQEKLSEGSMDQQAADLAKALQNLDGLGGMAAALERKDFAAASAQAAAAAEKYEKGEAKLPDAAKAKEAADRLNKVAQQLPKSSAAAAALQKMQDALGQQDKSAMSDGTRQLSKSMADQAKQQAQNRDLAMQMAQLSNWRDNMGDADDQSDGQPGEGKPGQGQPGEGQMAKGQPGKGPPGAPGQGPPGSGAPGGSAPGGTQPGGSGLSLAALVQAQSNQLGGTKAGVGVDNNDYGAATSLDSTKNKVTVTGQAGSGHSETQTESTNDPHFEGTASGVNPQQLAAYERLSEQASIDENLPVSDRQAIKRYFQTIRPGDTDTSH